MFPAHIRETENGRQIQTAAEHSRNTAAYAGQRLRCIGLEQTGILMGLLHDCGKFKEEFEQYLTDPNGTRGSVNHTFAGCRFLLEHYHGPTEDPWVKLSAEILALAVASHHGLFDCVDENRNSGFLHRIEKEGLGYSESIQNFLAECVSESELDKLFLQSNAELQAVCEKNAGEDPEESFFWISILSRLLLSALIDADRRDTAEFMNDTPSFSEPEDYGAFWKPYMERVEKKLDSLPGDTDICRARREISNRCSAVAEKKGGIYRLNVPTGSGKTLSSLRYALTHAAKWGKRRLIFTSPLLSVLEQNAAVIREYLGEDSLILEHHSNVLRTEEGEALDRRELAVASWEAPVIITTLVQLLTTFFDGRTTAIRRFQALCGSIIVIDEVQTVPAKMLSLFNLTIDFLSKVCGTTILLCSATQPCLEKAVHPLPDTVTDVITYDPILWRPFQRTQIVDAGTKTLEEVVAFAEEELERVRSLLVICNRKDEAENLYRQLQGRAEVSCHLSASMCMAHRRDVLQKLMTALSHKRKCLCVSTQVIEAGVDISFQRVIRLAAGMDSVIQAAGRCNRHGESRESETVYVVDCLAENLGRLREIRDGKRATMSLLDSYRRCPEQYGFALDSEQAICGYYERRYKAMPLQYQDFYIKKYGTTLLDLMSCNTKYYDENCSFEGMFLLNQALKLAGKVFTVFDSNTRDLIVPYGEGSELMPG